MPGFDGQQDGIFVVAGRREQLHQVRMARGTMVSVDVRCRLGWDDEEWAPRAARPDEVDNAEPSRFCGWCCREYRKGGEDGEID